MCHWSVEKVTTLRKVMNELHHYLSCCRKLSLIYFHFVNCVVSLQSRDRIGTGGPVVDCSRLFDNDLPDGSVLLHVFPMFPNRVLLLPQHLPFFWNCFDWTPVWRCVLGKEHSFSLILCVFENQSILTSVSRSCRYYHHPCETFVLFVCIRIYSLSFILCFSYTIFNMFKKKKYIEKVKLFFCWWKIQCCAVIVLLDEHVHRCQK